MSFGAFHDIGLGGFFTGNVEEATCGFDRELELAQLRPRTVRSILRATALERNANSVQSPGGSENVIAMSCPWRDAFS